MTIDEMQANAKVTLLSGEGETLFPALRLPLPGPEGEVLVFAYWKDERLVITLDTEGAGVSVDTQVNINNAMIFEDVVE